MQLVENLCGFVGILEQMNADTQNTVAGEMVCRVPG